jgi:ammonium transporter, Amt family
VTPAPVSAQVCAVLILLIPLALAGLALMNCGLGRSRSAAHVLMAALTASAVAAVAYVVCGFAWQGFSGRPAYAFVAAGKPWNWIGADRFFLSGLDFDGSPAALAASFGVFAAALAASIPLGAGAERWRLAGSVASAAVLGGWTFPLFAHWAWGGGWLKQLGSNYGLGIGFADAGGAGVIQTVGGLTALSVTWILGPRRGKYSPDGTPVAIPGHNSAFVLCGCLLAWIGWMGLNGAGAIVFYGVTPARLGLIAVNTLLAAGSALLVTALVTRARFSRPDASLSANGWVAGLVASSAGAPFLPPAAALIVGIVSGALVPICIEWFELGLGIDDPSGAVSVHGVAGLWGLLAAGLFARFPGGQPNQVLAQLAGIAALLGFIFPLTYGANWVLNRFVRYRVAPEGERQGLDLYELGANAYPEAAGYSEEFLQH